SRKLAWRLGFEICEGRVRGWLPHHGQLRDCWVATLLDTDEPWPRRPWLQAPVIELDGVRLRPLREADDTRVVEACSDPMSAQWLGTLPVPFGLGDAVAWR